MPNVSNSIETAQDMSQELIDLIERRPSINAQAATLIKTLNDLLQKLSDLTNDNSKTGAALDLQTAMAPLYISPLDDLIAANVAMSKGGPLNTGKTVSTPQLMKENALAKPLISTLREILSGLGGEPYVPNPLPCGPAPY